MKLQIIYRQSSVKNLLVKTFQGIILLVGLRYLLILNYKLKQSVGKPSKPMLSLYKGRPHRDYIKLAYSKRGLLILKYSIC